MTYLTAHCSPSSSSALPAGCAGADGVDAVGMAVRIACRWTAPIGCFRRRRHALHAQIPVVAADGQLRFPC